MTALENWYVFNQEASLSEIKKESKDCISFRDLNTVSKEYQILDSLIEGQGI